MIRDKKPGGWPNLRRISANQLATPGARSISIQPVLTRDDRARDAGESGRDGSPRGGANTLPRGRTDDVPRVTVAEAVA